MCSSAQQVEDVHLLCLIALQIAPFELVMPIFFSVLAHYLSFFTVVVTIMAYKLV